MTKKINRGRLSQVRKKMADIVDLIIQSGKLTSRLNRMVKDVETLKFQSELEHHLNQYTDEEIASFQNIIAYLSRIKNESDINTSRAIEALNKLGETAMID